MNKNWRGIFIVFVFPALLLAGFLLPSLVLAEEVKEELDQNNPFCMLYMPYNMNYLMRYGQSFIPSTSNISSVSMILQPIYEGYPGYITQLKLCRGSMTVPLWSDPLADWYCDKPGQTLLATATAVMDYGDPWKKFTFKEPVSVVPGESLFIMVEGRHISACGEKYNDYYPMGEARSGYNALDFAFRTYYDPNWTGKKRKPVLIVPGIMGSYLKEASTSKELWLNLGEYLLPGSDSSLLKLKMDKYGSSLGQLSVDGAIEEVLTKDFYKGLIEELEANGYELNKDLFIFPYDWRYNLDCLAGVGECPDDGVANLNSRIEWIKLYTGFDKIDIVAHSMGGLITKAYMEEFGESSVGKFIAVATPHYGAPKGAKTLMYGDDLGVRLPGLVILNEKTIKELAQNIPSLYHLLPSGKFFDLYDSYLVDSYDYDGNGVFGKLDHDNSNVFLSNTGRNEYLISQAKEFHDKVDDFVYDDSYSISGCGLPTVGKIIILNKEKNGKYEYILDYVSGDETVPLYSAQKFGNERYSAYKAEHGTISSIKGVKQLISAILADRQKDFDYSEYEKIKPASEECPFKGVAISFHSPITMEVYDESGNFVGRNADGDIEIGIPGAQYDEIEDNKFVFLPDGGEYIVKGLATDNGSFNARIRKIDNGQYTQEEYFNEVPLVNQITTVEISIGVDQIEHEINIDNNGDDVFEEERVPDSVLVGDEINDLTVPETTANVDGVIGSNDYYVSDVKLELSAFDSVSGVLKTGYSLDSGISWLKYDSAVLMDKNGTTTILYSSTDRAGNREENKEIVVNIDKIAPEITIFIPQEGQEIEHDKSLQVEYFFEDLLSGVDNGKLELYLDNQLMSSSVIDLFVYKNGQYRTKIKVSDLAGNFSEKEVGFRVISTISSAISDVDRLYKEKQIKKTGTRDDIKDDLLWIKNYLEKNAKKEEKRWEVEKKMMEKCVAKKGRSWCDAKLGKVFQRTDYHLDKIRQKIVEIKYKAILKKLEIYERLGMISEIGYNIISDDVKYLLNKI